MEDKFESAALLMPTVALRGLVVFPGMQVHFDVGREKSIDALKAALAGDRKIFLTAQKDIAVDIPISTTSISSALSRLFRASRSSRARGI